MWGTEMHGGETRCGGRRSASAVVEFVVVSRKTLIAARSTFRVLHCTRMRSWAIIGCIVYDIVRVGDA